MTASPKPQRLEARISPEQKELITRAAQVTGLSLTDFVVQSAYQAAQDTLTRWRECQLAEQDAQLFVETLMNPPAPNADLLKAARRSQERLGS